MNDSEKFNKLCENVDRINRGLYGDRDNKQKGLMTDVAEIKVWIESSKTKVTFLAGIGAAIGFGITKAWEWIVSGQK